MNAIIALCHFCEVHGPCAIFCTQTLRQHKLDNLTRLNDLPIDNKDCPACNSLGQANAIYSRDTESEATLLSTQTAVLPEVIGLVKQAAVRSLSCETTGSKDGGFVYFGDTARGHVLSHTFHVYDAQARGSSQLYSIVVLMRDKYYLLNTKPFLSEHMLKTSAEIQGAAQKLKAQEELQMPVGMQRRASAEPPLGKLPRSLCQLTGESNIYAYLHAHFAFILLAATRVFSEHITYGNLPWLQSANALQTPLSSVLLLQQKQQHEGMQQQDREHEQFYSLRHIKMRTKDEFTAVCYCALAGIKIIVRGEEDQTRDFMLCLKKMLPYEMQHLMRLNAQPHSLSSEYKIISVANEIPVPIASSNVLRIDFLSHTKDGRDILIKWPGQLPNRLPNLLVKLMKAVNESKFTELVVNKQTAVLIEEWRNKIICLNHGKSSSSQGKLKTVLGMQSQDQVLINYWSAYLR